MIVIYLELFEIHCTIYGTNIAQWPARLHPLLPPEVHATFQAMREIDWKTKVKARLFKDYRVSCLNLSCRLDEIVRKPGERWVTCGQRVLNFVRRWIEGRKTVKEMCELIAMEKLMKIMPKQIAVKVKERKPKTLEQALYWADDV